METDLMLNKNELEDDEIISLVESLTPKIMYSKPNFLSPKVNEFKIGDYEAIPIDAETESKIRELKKITNSIEKKVLPDAEFKPAKKYKIDYTGDLNPQQLTAVLTTNLPLLVIAGAGTGKTKVITYKVSWLIENGVQPSQIALLTFTRKAADEMLTRIAQLLGDKSISNNVTGGTFHGFSYMVFNQYGKLLGIPANFTIIDDADATGILSLLRHEMKLPGHKDERPFPKADTVQDIISKARNHDLLIAETIQIFYENQNPFIKEIELLDRLYTVYKQRSNIFDFDDMMTVLRDKLRDDEVFRNKLQERIKFVLVDEYQDTNNTQREIVELICQGKSNLTVVGDDFQSIYSFRGANFENILRFPQSFSNCGVVKLEENYRCSQGILDFANCVTDKAQIGFKKKLFSRKDSFNKPQFKQLADGPEEAEFIVDKILEIRDNNLELSDFAILTRASWHNNYIQAELMKRHMLFVVVGGIKFSERRHVKDIIAFLKLTFNPLDAVAWHMILELIGGVGPIKASEIVNHIHANAGKINFDRFYGRKYYQDLKELERLYGKLNQDGLSPVQMLDILYPYYIPILKRVEEEYDVRIKDLETFRVIAGKYDNLQKFLADFLLEPPSNRYQKENESLIDNDEKPLVVSTIHSAKGLEWHSVFMPHAVDGLFPSVKAMQSLEDMEEEWRLFYVACTRAKENLFLTMPSYIQSWDSVFTLPSRFLTEIEDVKYEVI